MEYKSLDSKRYEIRLITILPLSSGDDALSAAIRCTVEHVSLHPDSRLGRSAGAPPSESSINFDRYVTDRPNEIFKVDLSEDVGVTRQDESHPKHSNSLGRLGKDFGRKIGLKSKTKVQTPQQSRITVQEVSESVQPEEHKEGVAASSGVENRNGDPISSPSSAPKAHPSHTLTDGAMAQSRFTWGDYVAMSYCWDDSTTTREIFLNGTSHQATENLEAGLRQFRNMDYFKNGGKIWIDALCINQADDKERSAQVQIMGTIYQQAGNVVVWLGESTQGSEAAIGELQYFSRFYRTEYLEAMDDRDAYTAQAHREIAHFKLKGSMQVWKNDMEESYSTAKPTRMDVDIYDFFNRPYWRRLWIIQELAHGRAGMPIICGSRVTQWRYVRDAGFLYASIIDVLREATRRALDERDRIAEEEHSVYHVDAIAQLECHGHRKVLPKVDGTFMPIQSTPGPDHGPLRGSALKQALLLFSQAHATNPKDRVYGMLALPGLPNLNIKVDYTKTIREVFTEFSRACVERRSLDLLSFLDGAGTVAYEAADQRLPCWVPGFAAKPHSRIGLIEGPWHASGLDQGFVVGGPGGVPQFIFPHFTGENEDLLVCYGFEAEAIDGLGAIPSLDRKHIRLHPMFKADVVQPSQPRLWPHKDDTPDTIVFWTLVGAHI